MANDQTKAMKALLTSTDPGTRALIADHLIQGQEAFRRVRLFEKELIEMALAAIEGEPTSFQREMARAAVINALQQSGTVASYLKDVRIVCGIEETSNDA